MSKKIFILYLFSFLFFLLFLYTVCMLINWGLQNELSLLDMWMYDIEDVQGDDFYLKYELSSLLWMFTTISVILFFTSLSLWVNASIFRRFRGEVNSEASSALFGKEVPSKR